MPGLHTVVYITSQIKHKTHDEHGLGNRWPL